MRKRLFVRRCAVRTIFLQDIGHNGTTHPARASRATGAAKAPTRSLIFHFYRGHGPLLPPRPCSSVGAGRARDGRRGTVFCSHRLRRTPERPGLRSHAGAWERAAARFPGAPCTSLPRAHARRHRAEKFFAPTHPARMVANGARGAPYRKTTGYAHSRVGCAARTMCEGPFRNDGVTVVHRPPGGAFRR